MLLFFLFVLGLVFGSFLNVVIFRLKSGEPIIRWRSHCDQCGKTLGPWELIPLVSFFMQRGRCRGCREPLSWQYPLVELACGVLFLLLYDKYDDLIALWNLRRALGIEAKFVQPLFLLPIRDALFLMILLVVFVFDWKYLLIADRFILPSIVVAFATNLMLGFSAFEMLLVGGGLALFFALQYFISHGRWVGGGDIRLGMLVGCMLLWPAALDALISSYLLGAIVGIILIALRIKSWKSPVPYGTFLAFTAGYSLLYGDLVLSRYLSIFAA